MKQCPFCAEDIKDAAVVCKHCGREIKQTARVPLRPLVGTPTPIATSVTTAGWIFVVVVVGLFAIALVFWARTPVSPANPSRTARATRAASAPDVPASIQRKLATIDCDCPVSEGDARALRFRSLLDQLAGKWYEEPQRIADISVAARNSLGRDGISESLLKIMEGLNQAPHVPFANFEYAEHVAMYVMLRKSGTRHETAVGGLSKAMQGQALRELRSK